MAKIQKTQSFSSPQVNFGTIRPFVQNVVLCHILENHFSLFEQIAMRRVCRLWQESVDQIWNKERSLVLNMKNTPMKSLLSTELRIPNLKFDEFDSPNATKGVELTIGKNHWKCPTIDLLGDLFCDMEHLTIFYELSPEFEATENLFYFIQKFHKVKEFSLIMPLSGTNVRMSFLSQLFKSIQEDFASLHTLHIYLPHSAYASPFPALKNEHFLKTLPMLKNYSLNCTVENLFEMVQTIGKSLPAADCPMQSLSINVRYTNSLSQIETLFKQNPNLSQLKRLALTELNAKSLMQSMISHFTQLECLYLTQYEYVSEGSYRKSKIDFSNDLIQTLSKLSHLKELYLVDFRIELLDNCESLPNIRKLTFVAQYCLHTDIKRQYYRLNGMDWFAQVEPSLMYSRFLDCFARQFPNLEQLTVRLLENNFEQNFSGLCFAHFDHLKNLRLIDRNRNIINV